MRPFAKLWKCQRGTAALEFVLIVPLLMALIFAGVTFGQAIYTRYKLSAAASEAARACGLSGDDVDLNACQQVAQQRASSVASYCSGAPAIQVTRQPLAGLRHVDAIQVEIRCQFVGTVGAGLLQQYGVSIINLTTSATMPL